MFYDSTYFLVIIGIIISAIASSNVSATFNKYKEYGNSKGLTGQQAASYILKDAGITDVKIERISGNLTDHYDPTNKVLRLSDNVYGSTSIAAIGVAAHECGHAVQHQEGYGPLKLRSLSVPLANFGSKLSIPLVIAGLVLGAVRLADLGVILFAFVVFFQFITLPVEFNASARAIKVLDENNLLNENELAASRKVLKAAAMTYVAAVFVSLLQLLRLVMLTRRNRD